ncbi:hypothetical protein [Ruminococcus sp.]|uniref:hypothetical protein n=1 Tax=Ruminococcus sp. TaxID=41978 RepID=UPI0025D26340|nr:hypothetical protein [Ruminococcus sp.]MCR4637891.1 hypothetical protein [Ruminococcus sp.]
MKKISTYLPSLLISVLLVFLTIAGAAMLLVDINISAEKLKKLAQKNSLETSIYPEINKYYKDKYNTTGIPAEVFMDAVDEDYIRLYEDAYIDSAFDALESGAKMVVAHPKNTKLEENIDEFFNTFAEDNNYEKDDNFGLKLRNTKENAYTTIGSFCDVYKFSSMNQHGILSKLSIVYSHRTEATAAVLCALVLMIILLTLINHKKKITAMYWCGVSSLVSGILGAIPSIYLIASHYYDSFTIKQAPVFTAFTSLMYKYTEAFTAVTIAIGVVGISLMVIYGVIHEKKKYPNVKPTKID